MTHLSKIKNHQKIARDALAGCMHHLLLTHRPQTVVDILHAEIINILTEHTIEDELDNGDS